MQSSPLGDFPSLSPSFSCYSSSGKLAETAARVVEESRVAESESDIGERFYDTNDGNTRILGGQNREIEEGGEKNDEEEQEDDEFEFAYVTETSLISADEIFCNGQIRPVLPIFNRDLVIAGDTEMDQNYEAMKKPKPLPLESIRLPLKKLLTGAGDSSRSYSCSSEADELEGIPPGMYCVWRPRQMEESPARCKKSNSTGSSKRWKFRDLLFRTNSDGKDDTLVFLTPKANPKKKQEKVKKAAKETEKLKAKAIARGNGVMVPANYTRNGTLNYVCNNQRRSCQPYRQDLVGFWATVNGFSKNLHPY